MKIDIENNSPVFSEGNVEILLPHYMNSLSESDIKKVFKKTNKNQLIISIGISDTNEIMFLTGDLKFMSYRATDYFNQLSTFHPFKVGQMIFVQLNKNIENYYEINSKNLIENSQLIDVFLSKDEDNDTKTKTTNKRPSRKKP